MARKMKFSDQTPSESQTPVPQASDGTQSDEHAIGGADQTEKANPRESSLVLKNATKESLKHTTGGRPKKPM
jgi:hypothetical protein